MGEPANNKRPEPFAFEKALELDKPKPKSAPAAKVDAKPSLQMPSKKFLAVWVVAVLLLGVGILVFRLKKAPPEAILTATLRLSKSILPKENVKELSLAMAFRLVKSKQYEPAKKIFEEILISEPTNVSVLNNLAYLAGEQGNLTRATEYLQTALQISDKCAECFNNLGSILYKQGKLPEAKSNFERAVANDPKYPDARLNLAVLYEELADWPSAAEAYKQAEPLVIEPEVKKWVGQRAVWLSEISQATKRDVAGAPGASAK